MRIAAAKQTEKHEAREEGIGLTCFSVFEVVSPLCQSVYRPNK